MSLIKSKLNLTIDAVMFICMILITGIGFLIRYILLPGFKRNDIYGQNIDLSFLGFDRHEWGTIHLIISLIFIGLLLIHLTLHLQLINAIFKRIISSKNIRACISLGLLVLSLLFIVGPFLVMPEVSVQRSPHTPENQNKQTTIYREIHEIEIQGSMTIQEVANKYHILSSTLIAEMNIAPMDSNKRIGQLRKKYGFDMNKLKQAIESNINK